MTKEWLLMKRGLYYRPDNCGYTGIKDHAGRYSLEEMNGSIEAGNGVTGIHEAGAPEFITACFDDLAREHLIKQRDDARAAIRTLLAREQEFAKHSGFSDCRCINLSRDGEREYETGTCPHQIARKLVNG